MQTPFSNNGYISRNGQQSPLHREHAIHNSFKRGSIIDLKSSPQRMEAKVLTIALTLLGIGSYIGGILSNLENWKSDLLFLCGLAFALLKMVRLTINIIQSCRREEIEQKILRKKIEED